MQLAIFLFKFRRCAGQQCANRRVIQSERRGEFSVGKARVAEQQQPGGNRLQRLQDRLDPRLLLGAQHIRQWPTAARTAHHLGACCLVTFRQACVTPASPSC